MLTGLVTATIDTSQAQASVGNSHGVLQEASPERRREFHEILSHSLPRFRRIAMRWLRNPEDAEDAVQDAMLSAFTHIARFDGRAQMSTWLMAIVINAVRMQIRRRPRGQMLSFDWSPNDDQWSPSEVLADPRPTPEQILERRELHELVTALTDRLPRSQRAPLKLRLRDELSIQETATKLGAPEGTVKAQLARGRAKLTEQFHKAIGTSKARHSRPKSKVRGKTSFSEYQRDQAQGTPQLPIAAYAEQGGHEVWVGA